MKNNNTSKTLTFEDAMNELEKIIDKIDSDNVKLDEMVKLFERGTYLITYCKSQLNNVENKIYELIKVQDNLNIKELKK